MDKFTSHANLKYYIFYIFLNVHYNWHTLMKNVNFLSMPKGSNFESIYMLIFCYMPFEGLFLTDTKLQFLLFYVLIIRNLQEAEPI